MRRQKVSDLPETSTRSAMLALSLLVLLSWAIYAHCFAVVTYILSLPTYIEAAFSGLSLVNSTLNNLTQSSDPLVNFQIYEPVFTPKEEGKYGCVHTMTLMEKVFENTYGFPFVGTYKPPPCAFNRVTMNFTVRVKGEQFDRMGIMYLGDIEVFRTTTSEPTPDGIIWTYVKEMDQYNTLWKQEQKLIFDMPNIVRGPYTGPLITTLTATFFTVPQNRQVADEILPISRGNSGKDEGSAFSVPSDVAKVTYSFKSKYNKAVVSLSACGQQREEFWYNAVLTSDADTFKRRTGDSLVRYSPFREVQLLIDGKLAGVSWPFPYIFTGGLVPGIWQPVVQIGTYDLKQHEIDVTPWLGYLSDGKDHEFQIKIVGLNDDGKGNATLSDTVEGWWVISGTIFLFNSDGPTISQPEPPSIQAENPRIEVSSSKSTTSTGDPESLTYSIEVSRSLSISSSSGSWAQDLSFHNAGSLTDEGRTQAITQSTKGNDTSKSGYSREYTYPLSVNTTWSKPSAGSLSLSGSVSSGLSLSITGPSVFPNGIQNFNLDSPALMPLDTSTQEVQLSPINATAPADMTASWTITQSGEGKYFDTDADDQSYSFGSHRQDFAFEGKDGSAGVGGRSWEKYTRSVEVVNLTVVRDETSLEGETIAVPVTRDVQAEGGGMVSILGRLACRWGGLV
ncbi:uncharacterized protein KY384_000099 [Bacidia gigantensis]|uniref:uncharacterized protein n=1 Tax=Bacidia gigantensis TaxID=2732470 RepID=UPI001D057DAB|nr:uncharacterized protein KY384_000099 [Bacidia gigantensis]KAG8526106.1 hypothetical protein KY384_000099 [Bacidia gigantensis]